MSERAEIVAAIQDNPDADEPRLAGADWFESQPGEDNKARAEFIRLQIMRANLPEYDIRQSEMFADEVRLLKQWQHVWMGSHFAFKKCIFRRGFIDYVHLHLKHYLHHRKQLHALEPVADLQLAGWHRAKDHLVERVARCEELRYIRSLKIHKGGPHASPRSNVLTLLGSPFLDRLKHFSAVVIELRRREREQFEQLPVLARLDSLQLPDPTMSFESRPDQESDKPGFWFENGVGATTDWKLRQFAVRIPHSRGERLCDAFTGAGFWGNLTELSLEGDIKPWPLTASLPQRLRKLRLEFWNDGTEAIESLMPQLCHRPLESFEISGVGVPPEHLHKLLSEDRLNRLAVAEPVKGQHQAIAESGARLRELALRCDSTIDKGLELLMNSPLSQTLVRLHLSQLTDSQVKGLGQVAWPALRFLALPDSGTASASLAQAIQATDFPSLNWLWSSCCEEAWLATLEPDLVLACQALPKLVGAGLQYLSVDDATARLVAPISYGFSGGPQDSRADNAKWRSTFDPSRWPACDEGLRQLVDWIRDPREMRERYF